MMKRAWVSVLLTSMLVLSGFASSPILAREAKPDGVMMASFTATAQSDSILVQWETVTEIWLSGFNLYREDETGQLVQLNEALIPSQWPGSPVGGVYQWVDELSPDDYVYWLDVVNVYGSSDLYGPANTVFPEPDPIEAGFTPLSSAIVLGDSVTFTNLSTGEEPLTYEWDFGDSSPVSNVEHPSHIYEQAGAHTVVLTVTNPFEQGIAVGSVDVYVALAIGISGNGAVEPSAGTHVYAPGVEVSLAATADPGWAFEGWSGDIVTVTNPLTLTMAGNVNVTATFEEVFTLILTQAGTGTGVVEPDPAATHLYPSGAKVALTATPAAGSVFVGWSGDVVTTTNPLTIAMTGDTNITATFEQIPEEVEEDFALTIAKAGTGDGTVEPSLGVHTAPAGSTMTLIALPAPGSVFAGWSGDVVTAANQLTVTIDRDLEAVAVFEKATFRIFLPVVQRDNGD